MEAAASPPGFGLALIDTEWRRWERLIGRISADDFTRQLFEGEAGSATWTIRDVLTHIAAWKRNTIRVAQMHEAGADLPLEQTPDDVLGIDVNAFNDDVYRRWRDRSVAEAIAEHRNAHAELMAILRRLPPGEDPAASDADMALPRNLASATASSPRDGRARPALVDKGSAKAAVAHRHPQHFAPVPWRGGSWSSAVAAVARERPDA